jgi:hypothetical protein
MNGASANFVACVAFMLGTDGCHSNSGTDKVSDAGPAYAADCGFIELVPPFIQAHSSLDGAIICQAAFTAVAKVPDDGAFSPFVIDAVSCDDSPPFRGCPVAADGATPGCTFALLGIAGLNPPEARYSVQVSSPGFQSTVVTDVHGGQDGCVRPQAASSSFAALDPA